MTEDFVPSSSLDSHTMPMEVQIPLLDSASDAKDSSNNNADQYVNVIPSKQDTTTFVEKTSNNYRQPSVKYTDRSSYNESQVPKLSDRLFAPAQLVTATFYRALLSEFLGTMLLVLVGASIGLPVSNKSIPDLHGALAAGLTVATIIVGFGHTSGAHINPAVTVTFLVACEIDILRAICYIGMQLLGATAGCLLLRSITPPHAHSNLGMTLVTKDVSLSQACIVEFIITFILCYTVHAICDKRRDDIGGSKALAVGLSVVIGCLFGGPYTGGSMNPARSFGPATVMNSWENHWVYWLGPLSGSIVAALIYAHILKKPHPIIVHSESHSHVHIDKSDHL